MEGGLLSLKWNNHKSTFFHVLSNVRKKKDSYSDATLACDGKFYPVHKLVLSSCSDYFEEMFDQAGQAQCKHPFIVLKDIKCDELECLLSYMYVGEVNVVQEKLAGLIKAAECLRIKGLAVPDEEPSNSSNKSSREKRQSDNSVNSEPKRRRQDEASSSSRQNNSRSGERRKSNEPDNINKSNTVSDSSSNQADRKEKQSSNDIVKTEEEDDVPTELPIMVKEEIDTVDLIEDTSHDNFSDLKDTDTDDMGFDDGTFMANDSNSREDAMNQSASTSQMVPKNVSSATHCSMWPSNSAEMTVGFSNATAVVPFLNSSEETECSSGQNPLNFGSSYGFNIMQNERFLENIEEDNSDLYSLKYLEKFLVVRQDSEGPSKVYQCPFCPNIKTRRDHFQDHLFTHTGEKRFACQLCANKFSRKCSLVRHMKKLHNII